jgi:PAS domain S-box-containing protein
MNGFQIAENAPAALLQTGADGTIQWANLAQLAMLGYSRMEYIGANAADFHADKSEGSDVIVRLARGETLRDYQTTLRARDGTLRTVLLNSNADVENGHVLRTRLFTQDITGRHCAEEDLRRLNAELEEKVRQRTAQLEATSKEMESFGYAVSHDLRAPLRASRGFAEVLLEVHASQLDSRGQDLLRRACAATIQMERLIEDLLKLANVSRGGLQMDEVNLSSLTSDIAAELASSDPSRAVQVVIEPECMARGDQRLVRLALDNLLRNAWKFTSKRADARIEFGRSDGEKAAFFVRDNGAGFDMAYAKKLFGLFQRLHATCEYPGTGVGLATVQRVINRHGGQAWGIGEVNKGATFYFTLPGISPP